MKLILSIERRDNLGGSCRPTGTDLDYDGPVLQS
jgi:hypothetical protein